MDASPIEEKSTAAISAGRTDVSTKIEHKKIGDVVLIPQPTDDPEDPLVSARGR
jgi:hypothetical protein